MSSTGFDVSLDLPGRLLGDRLTGWLGVACGLAVELALARHGGFLAGPGAAAAAALLAWQWWRTHDRVRSLRLGPAGLHLQLGDGAAEPGTVTRSRAVGRSVVLHWQAGRRRGALWLTPVDAAPDRLRELRVALAARPAAAR
jgi:hypothetical protein